MHGDGNGGNGGPPRMSIPEALALMGPSRTPLDRLVRFTCEQLADVITTFKAMHQRMDLQQAEIEQLRALLLPGQPANNGGEDEGSTLQ